MSREQDLNNPSLPSQGPPIRSVRNSLQRGTSQTHTAHLFPAGILNDELEGYFHSWLQAEMHGSEPEAGQIDTSNQARE